MPRRSAAPGTAGCTTNPPVNANDDVSHRDNVSDPNPRLAPPVAYVTPASPSIPIDLNEPDTRSRPSPNVRMRLVSVGGVFENTRPFGRSVESNVTIPVSLGSRRLVPSARAFTSALNDKPKRRIQPLAGCGGNCGPACVQSPGVRPDAELKSARRRRTAELEDVLSRCSTDRR